MTETTIPTTIVLAADHAYCVDAGKSEMTPTPIGDTCYGRHDVESIPEAEALLNKLTDNTAVRDMWIGFLVKRALRAAQVDGSATVALVRDGAADLSRRYRLGALNHSRAVMQECDGEWNAGMAHRALAYYLVGHYARAIHCSIGAIASSSVEATTLKNELQEEWRRNQRAC